jgi:L-malate glycosyltransferase
VRIDQVTPDLVARDAVGAHILNVQRAILSRGIESEIFYEDAADDMLSLGRPIEEMFEAVPNRSLLFQAAIGSPGFDLIRQVNDPVMIHYHNMTPASLLESWEPNISAGVSLGRRQLAAFAPRCSLGLAVSHYNERELIDLGYSPTAVAPLLLDMSHDRTRVDHDLLKKLNSQKGPDAPSLLFVGKVSPHKAPHDLVAMLSALRELYYPHATLTLVGTPLGTTYLEALESYIAILGLEDAVIFAGGVSSEELEAYWQSADVFVCASEHEGFCAPLVEAMGHGVPVITFGSSAIPETVGTAGLVLNQKSPQFFAAAVHRVLRDDTLRSRLIDAGIQRSQFFDLEEAMQRFLDVLLANLH